jgi:hypothetical protein
VVVEIRQLLLKGRQGRRARMMVLAVVAAIIAALVLLLGPVAIIDKFRVGHEGLENHERRVPLP